MFHVPFGKGDKHAAALRAGLARLGPSFVARLCWWCDGTTTRNHESCHVCSKGRGYGAGTGLLIGNQPAPDSVVNQVLVVADADAGFVA